MSSSLYRPGFFSSLFKSCADSEFYHRVKDISLLRSIGFLTLFSLSISLLSFVILLLFWTQLFPSQESFLDEFDRVFPSIEGSFEKNQLSINPSQLVLFFGFDTEGNVVFSEDKSSQNMIRFQVNTDQSLDQAMITPPQVLGLYLYRDGLNFTTGFQNFSSSYETLAFEKPLSFTKGQLRILLEKGFPLLRDWAKSTLLTTIPIMIFVYSFIAEWILALFFSVIGIPFLLMMKKPIHYSFLLRLSFYSSVPALVITLITALLSISVSFVPIFVYLAFYYYGLRVYHSEQSQE